MANKYSRYTLQPYVSQYVDPQSVPVAQVLRQRYDQNKAKKDLVDRSLANIQVGEGDMYLKNQAVQGINSKIQNTVEVGDYENAGGVIDEIAQDFATNEGLQLASKSYLNRQEEIKTAKEIQMKTGRNMLDFGAVIDPETGAVIGHKFDNHKSFYQDENGEIVRNIYTGDTQLQLDYTTRKQKLLQSIAKSGNKLRVSDIAGLLEKWEGVSGSRANEVALNLLEEYMSTDEGQQEMRKLTELEGMSAIDAERFVLESMKDIANKQVGGEYSYMKDPKYVAGGDSPVNPQQAVFIPGKEIKTGETYEKAFEAENEAFEKLSIADEGELEDAKMEYALAQKRTQNLLEAATANGGAEIQQAGEERKKMFSGKREKYVAIESMLRAATRNNLTPTRFDSNPHLGNENYTVFDTDLITHDPDVAHNVLMLGGTEVINAAWGAFGAVTDFLSGKNVHNVRRMFSGPKAELELLKDDFGNIDLLNRFTGQEYTEDDKEEILKLAEEYYNWMYTKGDKYFDYAGKQALTEKQSFMMFSAEGSKSHTAVNKALQQLDINDFKFLTENGEEPSTEELESLVKSFSGTSDDGTVASSPKITFGGLSVSEGILGQKMLVKIGPLKYIASLKDINEEAGLAGLGFMQDVANQLGYGDEFFVSDATKRSIDSGLQSSKLLKQRSKKYTDIIEKIDSDISKSISESPLKEVSVDHLPEIQQKFIRSAHHAIKAPIRQLHEIAADLGGFYTIDAFYTALQPPEPGMNPSADYDRALKALNKVEQTPWKDLQLK